MLETLRIFYPYFSLAGGALLAALMLVCGLVYRGLDGERYSIFNHFISELGEVGVSRLAVVFNAGLVLAGLLLLPFVVGMGLTMGGVWALLGAAAGVFNTISLSLVGCFPMNDLKSHTRAAMVFFRSGLIMVLFFSVATLLQPVGNEVAPRYTLWFALLTFVAYAAFLVRLRGKSVIQSGEVNIHERRIKERPAFWALAMLEWAIFAANLVWFLSVSAALI